MFPLNNVIEIMGMSAPLWLPCAIVFEQWLVSKLPQNVQARVAVVANFATAAAEQKLAGSAGSDKKAAAMASMQAMSKRYGLPFDPEIASDLIEGVVLAWNQAKSPVTLPPAPPQA